jgi:hypothetical protein
MDTEQVRKTTRDIHRAGKKMCSVLHQKRPSIPYINRLPSTPTDGPFPDTKILARECLQFMNFIVILSFKTHTATSLNENESCSSCLKDLFELEFAHYIGELMSILSFSETFDSRYFGALFFATQQFNTDRFNLCQAIVFHSHTKKEKEYCHTCVQCTFDYIRLTEIMYQNLFLYSEDKIKINPMESFQVFRNISFYTSKTHDFMRRYFLYGSLTSISDRDFSGKNLEIETVRNKTRIDLLYNSTRVLFTGIPTPLTIKNEKKKTNE